MKAGLWFGVGVAITLVAVVVLLAAGWLIWGRQVWAMPMMGRNGPSLFGFRQPCAETGGWGRGMMGGRGPGMMGGTWGGRRGDACRYPQGSSPASGRSLDIEEAEDAFVDYLHDLGYDDLALSEVMEFEYNFYAIAEEPETGMGAMEMLLDKRTGAVSPEMGPNMMWNLKYGMHSRDRNADPVHGLSEEEVLDLAQRWLDENRPGLSTEEHADPFYGYYTIHTQRDGAIAGMLSVHGETGQVWYHTWHGDFIDMVELEGHAHTG